MKTISKKKFKKMKVDILKKYDKNNDNIVSIDEYLDIEISLGPKEKKGNINYHYQNYINIYNFFTILIMKKIKEFQIMCIPQFEIIYGNNYIERTTAMFDTYSKKYYFPSTMIEAIKECQISGIRLIYFTLIIKTSKSYFTHANMVIIDLKKKTLERFEPHGCATFYDNDMVNDFFETFALKYLKLHSFIYLKPTNISKKIGIQMKSDAYNGMCVTISAMYLHMRILNVNVKQYKIIDYFIKMSKKKLTKHILRFTKYIEKTLKKNEDFVNRLDYELYYNIFHEIKHYKNSMIKTF